MANEKFEAMLRECHDTPAEIEKARCEVIEELCRECIGDYFMYEITGSESDKAAYFDESSATIKNYGLEAECREYYKSNAERIKEEIKVWYEKNGLRPTGE